LAGLLTPYRASVRNRLHYAGESVLQATRLFAIALIR